LKTVNIKKSDLLEIVSDNLASHKRDYTEAMAGWHERIVDRYEAVLSDIRSGNYKQAIYPAVDLPMPESHEDDYMTILRMLELSADEIVELTYREFEQYVRDEWSWKESFTTTAGNYR
jgi:hypothetical protein